MSSSPASGRDHVQRVGRGALAAVGGALCLALVGAAVSPSWAGGSEGDTGSAVVGAFGLGDGLEASISERDGALTFAFPAGGVQLSWDSRAMGSNAYGLGDAWGLGLPGVQTDNGMRVTPPTGGAHGTYLPDETHPSGLAGYGAEDVVFEQINGELPARQSGTEAAAAPVESVPYAFVLHELGGTATYFSAAGDPVARVDALGGRAEWVWDDLVPHRLVALVNADGVVTELDWDSEPGTLVVSPGANLTAATPESGAGGVWRVELDGGRVSAVTDASGGRMAVGYDDTGLVSEVTGASGGTTQIGWRDGADRVPRVAVVRTVNPVGAELSVRRWSPAGDGVLSSGWPRFHGGDGEVFWSGDPSFRYQTELSDGATRVISEYNSSHLMVGRRMLATSPSGERELQDQSITYPGTEDGGVPDPAALPANWVSPTEVQVTFRDLAGRSRTTAERFEFDAVGRGVSHTGIDGTVSTTEYDQTVPEGRKLALGLPLVETVTAPDGQTSVARHTLNQEHTAIVATEVTAAKPGEEAVVVGRTEAEFRDDGTKVEERIYPSGGSGAEPTVTRWDEAVDLAAGTRTRLETIGADTTAAATVTEVSSLLHGGALETIDPLGNRAGTEYDVLGRPVVSIDAKQRMTTSRHETAQQDGRNALSVTRPDGVTRTELRDELGRVTRLTDDILDGEAVHGHERIIETREYPEPGTIAVTDAWGATTRMREDVFGRPVETVAPNGLTRLTIHDDVAGTVTTAVTPTGRLADAEFIETQTLDLAGRSVEQAGSRADQRAVPTVRTEYDGFGRTIAVTGGTLDTHIAFDAHGNPATTTLTPAGGFEGEAGADGSGGTTTATRRFDGFGASLEKVLVAADGTTRSGGARTLDGLGRTLTETDQLDRITRFEYTVDGLVTRAMAGSGQITEFSYDAETRAPVEMVVTSPVGYSVRTAHEYDPLTDRLIAVFDPTDRANTQITYAHDAHGNPTLVTYPDGTVIEYAYDAHGRRIGLTDAAGNSTAYAHTPEGLMTRAEQRDAEDRPLAAVSYEYDAFGRVITLTRGNGVVTAYEYTSASAVETEHTTKDGATQSLRRYAYDQNGNLTERVDTTRDEVDGVEDDVRITTTEYGYDAYDRLIRSAEHDGDADGPVAKETAYELSVSGDILMETVTVGTETVTRAFEYSPLGELAATTRTTTRGGPGGEIIESVREAQGYDAAGNLTQAGDGTRYEYDAMNRPVTETTPDGATTRTTYWADGSRRSRTTADDAVMFHWDGVTLINETHVLANAPSGSDDAGVAAYLIGSSRHARTTLGEAGVTTTYLGADRHGNITEHLGANGLVQTRLTYSDYGVPRSRPASPGGPETPRAPRHGLERIPFGYAGEYTDESGTLHLQSRSYDADSMRFTSMDVEDLHNLYAYANLNPITLVDPTGGDAASDVMNQWGSLILAACFTLVGMLASGGGAIFAVGAVVAAMDGLLAVARVVGEQNPETFVSRETLETLSDVALGVGAAIAMFGLAKAAISVGRGIAAATRTTGQAPPVPFFPESKVLSPPRGRAPKPQAQARWAAEQTEFQRELKLVGDQIEADGALLRQYGQALGDHTRRVRGLITNTQTRHHTDEPLEFFSNLGRRLANLELKDISTTAGVQRVSVIPEDSVIRANMAYIWERTGHFVENTPLAIEGFQSQVMALYNSAAPMAAVEQRLVQNYQRYEVIQAMLAKK